MADPNPPSLLALAACLTLAACASTDQTAQAPDDPAARPAETTTPAEPAEATPADTEPVAESSDPARDDGRPDWWFDGVDEADGRIRLCVEALGDTMRDARANAVDAAVERVGSLGGEQDRAQIEQTWVWPLPGPSSGGARYAGYALIAAPAAP